MYHSKFAQPKRSVVYPGLLGWVIQLAHVLVQEVRHACRGIGASVMNDGTEHGPMSLLDTFAHPSAFG